MKTLDLSWSEGSFGEVSPDGDGVYVIWHSLGPSNPETVYVGQGRFGQRLHERHYDGRLVHFLRHDLLVSWALVPEDQRGGVEHYLARVLEPRVGERWSDDEIVAVDLPFAYGTQIAATMIELLTEKEEE